MPMGAADRRIPAVGREMLTIVLREKYLPGGAAASHDPVVHRAAACHD